MTDGDTTRELSGAVPDADAYDDADFDPDAGETVTEDVTVALSLRVESGGEVVASDTVTDAATIVVENTAPSGEVTVGGDGEITFDG